MRSENTHTPASRNYFQIEGCPGSHGSRNLGDRSRKRYRKGLEDESLINWRKSVNKSDSQTKFELEATRTCFTDVPVVCIGEIDGRHSVRR